MDTEKGSCLPIEVIFPVGCVFSLGMQINSKAKFSPTSSTTKKYTPKLHETNLDHNPIFPENQ